LDSFGGKEFMRGINGKSDFGFGKERVKCAQSLLHFGWFVFCLYLADCFPRRESPIFLAIGNSAKKRATSKGRPFVRWILDLGEAGQEWAVPEWAAQEGDALPEMEEEWAIGK
jgi:hypothetical protein